MKCKRFYRDKEKYRKYHNGYNRRYYRRTQNAENSKQTWSDREIEIIMARESSDREIAEQIGRSVNAIQIKRHRMTMRGADDGRN